MAEKGILEDQQRVVCPSVVLVQCSEFILVLVFN